MISLVKEALSRKITVARKTLLLSLLVLSLAITIARITDTLLLMMLFSWLSAVHLTTYYLSKITEFRNIGSELGSLAITIATLLLIYFLAGESIVDGIDDSLLSSIGESLTFLSPFILAVEELFEDIGIGSYAQLPFLYREIAVLIFGLFLYVPLSAFFSFIIEKFAIGKPTSKVLNDSVIKFALIGTAIFSLIPVLIQFTYNSNNADYETWQIHAAGSPLWLVIVSINHFCYVILIRFSNDVSKDHLLTPENSNRESVRPLYNSYKDDDRFYEQLSFYWPHSKRGNNNESELQDFRTKDVESLVRGNTIYFEGSADHSVYSCIVDAMEKIRDRGEMSLVVCPNQCGELIFKQLQYDQHNALDSINRQRELCLSETFSHNDTPFDINQFYDLVVTEEQQLHKLFEKGSDELSNSIGRTGLFIFLDFHKIDASLVYLSLNSLQPDLYSSRAGVFFQSLNRVNLSTQINRIDTALGHKNKSKPAAYISNPADSGWLIWRASSELRSSLLLQSDIDTEKDNKWFTPPYLFLSTHRANLDIKGSDLPVALVASMSTDQSHDHFARNLQRERKLDDRQIAALKTARESTYTHFAPRNDPRIVVYEDDGSLVNQLLVAPSFHNIAPDYLVHIVVSGYLGRSFMLDTIRQAIENNGSKRTFIPLAQYPGIGLAEVGQLIIARLQNVHNGGLSEGDAYKLLALASGSIENDLDISISKSGLERFLDLVLPEFNGRVISAIDGNALQAESYTLDAGRDLTTRATSVRTVDQAGQVDSKESLGELALDDCGLLFHEHGIVKIRDQYMVITQLSERSGIKAEPKHIKDIRPHPEPTYHYCRNYSVVLNDSESGTRRFVIEKTFSAMQNRFPFALIQANVRRFSSGVVEHSIDVEPTPEFYNDANLTPLEINVERTFRNVLILNLPIKVQKSDIDNDTLILIASLSATLQAVVGLSFPALAKRLAVFPVNETDNSFTKKYHSFMGSLGCIFPSGEILGSYTGSILKTVRKNTADNGIEFPFSMVIVEDGEHDLGACRSIADNVEKIASRWKRYNEWATQSQAWNIPGKIEPNAALESDVFRAIAP